MSGDKYPKFRAAAVQAAPVFLNREATIDKVETLLAEATANGAKLVVFPESFIPCFPVWCLVQAPIDQHPLFTRLYENALDVKSDAFRKLASLAKKYNAFLSIGVTEKSDYSMGAMWNTNLLFDSNGNLVGKHRKIMPTWAEKLVHNFGDGSSLIVHETEIGKLGVLICGENTNTLARYSMVALGEQVHISTYPPCWPTMRKSTISGGYNMKDVIHVRAASHAFEGKVFNIASSGVLDEDAINQVAGDDETLREFLKNACPAATMIVGPDGEYASEPLVGEEGIVYADIDINREIALKGVHDIVGSYQRLDIFQLHVNRTRLKPAYFSEEENGTSVPEENTNDEADVI